MNTASRRSVAVPDRVTAISETGSSVTRFMRDGSAVRPDVSISTSLLQVQ